MVETRPQQQGERPDTAVPPNEGSNIGLLQAHGDPHVTNASSSFMDNLQTIAGAAFAAGMGGDNFINELKKAGHIPHVPKRNPDVTTGDGAKIWHNKDGQIDTLELGSGPVFSFTYKHGVAQKLVEPDGAKVGHRDQGDQWIRRTAENKQQVFYGNIIPSDDGSVTYASDSGYMERYNGNGFRTEMDHGRLMRVTDPEQRQTEFAYDQDGNVSKMKLPDGSIVFRQSDGRFYSHIPNIAQAEPTPYVDMQVDPKSGNVIVDTEKTRTTYSPSGVRTSSHDAPPKSRQNESVA